MLLKFPDGKLRVHSEPVDPRDRKNKDIVKQMIEAAKDWEAHRVDMCLALAAIQIGIPKQIIILRSVTSKAADFEVFYNAELGFHGTDIISTKESCLSFDHYEYVPRWAMVQVKATDKDGKEVSFTANDLLARQWQHETDHFKGKFFTEVTIKSLEAV